MPDLKDAGKLVGGALGGAVTVAALWVGISMSETPPTDDQIAQLYAASQAKIAALAAPDTFATDDVRACIPAHGGALKPCYPEVAELGTLGEPSYRVSYYACPWVADDGGVDVMRLDADQEACVRGAVVPPDDRARPDLVRIEKNGAVTRTPAGDL